MSGVVHMPRRGTVGGADESVWVTDVMGAPKVSPIGAGVDLQQNGTGGAPVRLGGMKPRPLALRRRGGRCPVLDHRTARKVASSDASAADLTQVKQECAAAK